MRTDVIERIKAVAGSAKLASVDFIDENGFLAKKSGRNYVNVILIFNDGQEFMVTKEEFCAFGNFKFNIGVTEQ